MREKRKTLSLLVNPETKRKKIAKVKNMEKIAFFINNI